VLPLGVAPVMAPEIEAALPAAGAMRLDAFTPQSPSVGKKRSPHQMGVPAVSSWEMTLVTACEVVSYLVGDVVESAIDDDMSMRTMISGSPTFSGMKVCSWHGAASGCG
jgi:hypothetical protein